MAKRQAKKPAKLNVGDAVHYARGFKAATKVARQLAIVVVGVPVLASLAILATALYVDHRSSVPTQTAKLEQRIDRLERMIDHEKLELGAQESLIRVLEHELEAAKHHHRESRALRWYRSHCGSIPCAP